ncbi:MAG: cytochrome c [Sulfuricurvum sp.]
MIKRYVTILLLFVLQLSAEYIDGKEVFEKYCWGCHHATSYAFGPPFKDIAKNRTADEIKAYIVAPEGLYEAFGYKRTAMTKLDMTPEEIDAVTAYIQSFKGK